MLARIARALLWGVGFYAVGVAAGIALVNLLSTNTHDRSVEAAMTGAFVAGPVAGIVGVVVGALRSAPGSRQPGS